MSQLWIFLLQVYGLMGLLSVFFVWKSCFRQKLSTKPIHKAASNDQQSGDHDSVLQQIQKARTLKVASDQERVQKLAKELASLKATQKQVRQQLSFLSTLQAVDKKDKDYYCIKKD